MIVKVAFFFCEVLGAEFDYRARRDGQGPVYRPLTTNHGAFSFYTSQFSTSAYLTYLIRCFTNKLRFARD